MVKRLWPVLIALLACGLIVAGCGDDDDDDAAGGAVTTTTTTTTAAGDAVGTAVEEAVDACKQSVAATPGLSEDTIADLEGLCDEAASGDVEDATAAGVEVCKAIAEDTIPDGSARETAISACESAIQ